MALKRCAECGKVVSTNAIFCVHCGNSPDGRGCTCVDYCPPGEETPDRPVCCNGKQACPAYIYDDPWAIEEARKRKKILRRKL